MKIVVLENHVKIFKFPIYIIFKQSNTEWAKTLFIPRYARHI